MGFPEKAFMLFFLSILFFFPFVTLYGAASEIQSGLLLRAAVQKKAKPAVITNLASRCNPNQVINEQSVWDCVRGLLCSDQQKNILGAAINAGIRIQLKNNPNKKRILVGDCGDQSCYLAEASLGLSGDKKSVDVAYNNLINGLRGQVCKDLDQHTVGGKKLREVLETYHRMYCHNSFGKEIRSKAKIFLGLLSSNYPLVEDEGFGENVSDEEREEEVGTILRHLENVSLNSEWP